MTIEELTRFATTMAKGGSSDKQALYVLERICKTEGPLLGEEDVKAIWETAKISLKPRLKGITQMVREYISELKPGTQFTLSDVTNYVMRRFETGTDPYRLCTKPEESCDKPGPTDINR